jgi:hypothetical protein
MVSSRAVAFALAVLGTGSCVGPTDIPDPCTGTFEATVSGSGGAPNTTFSGCSFYTADQFVVNMGKAGQHRITVGNNGARPDRTNSFAIGSWGTNDAIVGTFTFTNGTTRLFYSNSGTLTITETILGRVKGSVTMEMRENATNPVVTATVTATFDAPCAGQTLLGC